MSVTRHQVLAAMSSHMGIGNGVRGRDLAARLGCTERKLRSLISELIIEEGAQIGGRPETGYFIALRPEELDDSVEFHKRRAKHELLKASRLSGKPLLELAGQMVLPT